MPQDQFVADYVTEDDILIVSCGGNDIALAPGFLTIVNILWALFASSLGAQRQDGYAPGLGHFVHLFGKQTEDFIKEILDQRQVNYDSKKQFFFISGRICISSSFS